MFPQGIVNLSRLEGPAELHTDERGPRVVTSNIRRGRASDEQDDQGRFPIRLVTRLSGIAAERIRSWETRHDAAVSPTRSGGGARQYSPADLGRLGRLGRAVESGHLVGDIATLDDATLKGRLREEPTNDWDENSSFLMVAREAIKALVKRGRSKVLDLGSVAEDSNNTLGCLEDVSQRLDKRVTFWNGDREMTRAESNSGIDRIEFFDLLEGVVLEARGNDYESTCQPLVKRGAS